MSADSVQGVLQIGEGINFTQFATGNQIINDRGLMNTVIMAGKELILSVEDYHAKHLFRKIIVYAQDTIFQISIQSLLLSTGVPDGLVHGTFRPHFYREGFQSLLNPF